MHLTNAFNEEKHRNNETILFLDCCLPSILQALSEALSYATHVLSKNILYREVDGTNLFSTRLFCKRATASLPNSEINEHRFRARMYFFVKLHVLSTSNLEYFYTSCINSTITILDQISCKFICNTDCNC